MIDIHCHVLPGVDDGPADIDETLELCRIASDDGISAIVASPHHLNGVHANERQRILSAVQELNGLLREKALPLEVLSGCEVQMDGSLVTELRENRLATIADQGKFLLVELPRFFSLEVVLDQLHEMKLLGVTPIISHPERTPAIIETLHLAELFLREGALLQLTALSITGKGGKMPEQTAHKLLEHKMVHFVATDAHNTAIRPPLLSGAYQKVAELMGTDEAQRIFRHNPKMVVSGIMPSIPPILPLGHKGTGFISRMKTLFNR